MGDEEDDRTTRETPGLPPFLVIYHTIFNESLERNLTVPET